MGNINEIKMNSIRDRVYQNAVNHGWHEEKKSYEHWLCMVLTELMEAVDADRKGRYADTEAFSKYCDCVDFKENFERQIKDTVEDELADACIWLFDMAGVYDFDLEDYGYGKRHTIDYSDKSFTEAMYDMIEEMYLFKGCFDSKLNEIFAFCRTRNIDIFWHIEQKMKYNELRPYKHGGAKY